MFRISKGFRHCLTGKALLCEMELLEFRCAVNLAKTYDKKRTRVKRREREGGGGKGERERKL